MNWLRLIVFLGIGGTTLAASISGPPVCPTATLAVYTSSDFAPCTVGVGTIFLFSNFGFDPGSTGLSASQILVTPSELAQGGLDLDFSSSATLSIPAGQTEQFALSYTIDPPPPPEIPRFQLTVDPATLAKTDLCVNAAFTSDGVCPSGPPVTLSLVGSGTTIADLKGIVGELGVIDTLSISGGPSDPTVPFPNFGNTALTTIPEPSAGLLALCGSALLVFLARRVKPKLG